MDSSDYSAKSAAPASASYLFERVKTGGNGQTFVMNGDQYGRADLFVK